MNNTSLPQLLMIDEKHFSPNHAEHWAFITHQPAHIPHYIHTALDAPISPMGLCPDESQMNHHFWLIQGPADSADIFCTQIHQVENQKPQQLCHAFPSFCSPYAVPVQIKHIMTAESQSQAILCLTAHQKTDIYAFDVLYTVNQQFYRAGQTYSAYFSGWAYQLESIPADESVLIDTPEAIRHHRALNDILAQHHGQAPDNLQELLQAWQPQSSEDLQPIHINISQTIAYLYGDILGQEDEAWFQGKIIGKTSTKFFDQDYIFYDVVFVEDEQQQPIIMRLATLQDEFVVGQYIRGDIWLQVNIF